MNGLSQGKIIKTELGSHLNNTKRMAKEEKEKKKLNLEETLKALEKSYGKGCVMNGHATENNYEVISTSSIGLDEALGIGGIARGKIYEVFGWESSGKSTLAQTIMGKFQEAGHKCLLIDGENSIDSSYAKCLGLKVEDLLIAQLDEFGGEGAYNRMEKLVESGEVGIVVIDSYNSLQPLDILTDEVGTTTIGKHARMLGSVVQKANNLSKKYNCTFIFIGQMREKIGVMFGSPETTQGGNALKFYAHVRLKVVRSTSSENTVKDGAVKLGNLTRVDVIKNKLGIPFKSAEFNIIYGKGIDTIQELIDMAHENEVIRKYGKTITYEDNKFETDGFHQVLEDNPEMYAEIKQKLLAKLHTP